MSDKTYITSIDDPHCKRDVITNQLNDHTCEEYESCQKELDDLIKYRNEKITKRGLNPNDITPETDTTDEDCIIAHLKQKLPPLRLAYNGRLGGKSKKSLKNKARKSRKSRKARKSRRSKK